MFYSSQRQPRLWTILKWESFYWEIRMYCVAEKNCVMFIKTFVVEIKSFWWMIFLCFILHDQFISATKIFDFCMLRNTIEFIWENPSTFLTAAVPSLFCQESWRKSRLMFIFFQCNSVLIQCFRSPLFHERTSLLKIKAWAYLITSLILILLRFVHEAHFWPCLH